VRFFGMAPPDPQSSPSLSRIVRCDPDFVGDAKAFDRRLAETIGWCGMRMDPANPGTSLRSFETRPRALPSDCFELVHSATVMGRGSRFRAAPLHQAARHGGRLLAYFPDADLTDGAAEVESRGFFDVFNAPPWDTWVAYVEEEATGDWSYTSYLVAWVPPELLELAAAGIEVNPEDCIAWLGDTRTAVADWLRERGWTL
jgi:hypothetical protein